MDVSTSVLTEEALLDRGGLRPSAQVTILLRGSDAVGLAQNSMSLLCKLVIPCSRITISFVPSPPWSRNRNVSDP